MRFFKVILFVIGCLAALVGLVWIGQGTGYFPYPQNSFMIDETPWTYRGVGLLVVGLIVAGLARPWASRRS